MSGRKYTLPAGKGFVLALALSMIAAWPSVAPAQDFFTLSGPALKPGVALHTTNVRFRYGRHELLPSSDAVLDSIADFMRRHEGLVIEVAFIDRPGRRVDIHSLRVDLRRTQSVVDHLAARGIARDRLVARGMVLMPWDDFSTEWTDDPQERGELHGVHRQMHFAVLRTDHGR